MSIYIYNLGFNGTPGGACSINTSDNIYISLAAETSPADARVRPFTLTIQNSSNVVVKKFAYNRHDTGVFVMAINTVYDWRTPLFTLPIGTYTITPGYSAYSDIPAGLWYAENGEVFIEVAI